MTYWEIWQKEKYGSVLPDSDPQEETENGFQDRERDDNIAGCNEELVLIDKQF